MSSWPNWPTSFGKRGGRPFGSPEVDWFAAERALHSSLVASGLVAPPASDLQHIREKIYSYTSITSSFFDDFS